MADAPKTPRKILMTAQAEAQMDALRELSKPEEERRRKTFTDRLSQLQQIADRLGDEIERSDADLGKRLTFTREFAKILPLLERAERKHAIKLAQRSIEDMTAEELGAYNRAIVRAESRRSGKKAKLRNK